MWYWVICSMRYGVLSKNMRYVVGMRYACAAMCALWYVVYVFEIWIIRDIWYEIWGQDVV